MKKLRSPFVNNPPGGSTLWTNGKAGEILRAEFFGAASLSGRLKVWGGASFAAKPVKVWNGSAWILKPAKVWNGAAWV